MYQFTRGPVTLCCLLALACGPESETQATYPLPPGTTDIDPPPTTSATTGSDDTTEPTGTTEVMTSSDTGEEKCPDPNSYLDNGLCFCNEGFEWCNPNDVFDLSCCALGTCKVNQAVPPTCNDERDFSLCLTASNPSCGPEGSEFYYCSSGTWIPSPEATHAICQEEGFDFSFGCYNSGPLVEFECGTGPGTPCTTGTPPFCATEHSLHTCQWGKTFHTHCILSCEENGASGGVCDSTQDPPQCVCDP